jgi:ubiquinone/menaquinone biosynthesis C-methylase UbiE
MWENSPMKKLGKASSGNEKERVSAPRYRTFIRGELAKPEKIPVYERQTERKLRHASYSSKNIPSNPSWGSVASWYAKHLESPDTYHAQVILPNLVRLVGPKPGERILDIACGEGFFARALAKKGAILEGADVGAELLSIAKEKSPEIVFHHASAENLTPIPDGTFSQAIIVLAIQNIEHTDRVIASASRVLQPGGSFHIVMNHPAFRIPRSSAWEFNVKSGVQSRRIDAYMSESKADMEMHPGRADSPKTVSFHRPLQYYFKALASNGFTVDRLEEWISHKHSDSGPRAKAENRSRKEIPLFLYLRAVKR